jgi:hypothetical protein
VVTLRGSAAVFFDRVTSAVSAQQPFNRSTASANRLTRHVGHLIIWFGWPSSEQCGACGSELSCAPARREGVLWFGLWSQRT